MLSDVKVRVMFLGKFASSFKRLRLGRLLVIACLLSLLFNFLENQPARAAGPSIISFQGKVTNADGTNVTNGSYNFDFVMYDDVSLGTPSDGVHDKWHELTKSVTVTNGVFQTNLGSATALPDFNTNPSLYLAIRFNSDAAGYMTPRVQMASVPYALNADKLSGIAASTFVQLGGTQSGNINIGSGTITAGASTLSGNTSLGTVGTGTASSTIHIADTSDLTGTQLVTIGSTAKSTDIVTIQGGGAASTIILQTAASGGIDIGVNNVATKTINIGSVGTTAQATTVHVADSSGNAAQTISIGSNGSTSSVVDIDAGTGAAAIEIGNSATAHGIQIGTNATGANTVSIGGVNAGSTLTLESGTGTTALFNGATAHTIQFSTGAAVQTLTIGSLTGGSTTTIQGGTAAGAIKLVPGSGGNVIIGSATTDTTQALLQFDSFSTFADTATCNTTTNQGALYYNTATNVMRGCVNGAWEDMVSTAGLGLQLFGVVPDTGANPGDLAAVTGVQNGPCKVSVGGTTSTISWTACTAYSGGRKVLVTAGTAATAAGTSATVIFQHLCLTGTGSQPALSAIGVETANLATVSLASVTAPILCLADVKTTNGSAVITTVYDTRTYTNTEKETVSIGTTAPTVGMLVQTTATKGTVVPTTAANATNLAGVVVATTGAASTTTINGIIATRGPAAVKAITGTNAVAAYIFSSATAGYSKTAAAKPAEGTGTIYNLIGTARTAWSGATACAINADACAGSILTSIDKR